MLHTPEKLGIAWREVGSGGRGGLLFPWASLCVERISEKQCVAQWNDVNPNVHFLFTSASFLIAILVAQSPTKVVLNFCIASLFR